MAVLLIGCFSGMCFFYSIHPEANHKENHIQESLDVVFSWLLLPYSVHRVHKATLEFAYQL